MKHVIYYHVFIANDTDINNRVGNNCNNRVGVWREDNRWTYLLGGHPIYSHRAEDLQMFRFVISQLIKKPKPPVLLVGPGFAKQAAWW